MNPNPKLKENSHFILKGMPDLSLSYRYQIRIQNKLCSSCNMYVFPFLEGIVGRQNRGLGKKSPA